MMAAGVGGQCNANGMHVYRCFILMSPHSPAVHIPMDVGLWASSLAQPSLELDCIVDKMTCTVRETGVPQRSCYQGCHMHIPDVQHSFVRFHKPS